VGVSGYFRSGCVGTFSLELSDGRRRKCWSNKARYLNPARESRLLMPFANPKEHLGHDRRLNVQNEPENLLIWLG